MKSYEKFIDILSTIFLLAVGVLGIFVSVLDFVGTDFENGIWKWLKGPLPIILLIVALLALALGLERISRFQQINRQLSGIEQLVRAAPDQIIQALHGVRVRALSNTKNLNETKYKLLEDAQDFVFDTELCLPASPDSSSLQIKQSRYRKLLNDKVINEDLLHRYIQVVYDKGHFESLLRKVLQFHEYKYYVGCYIGAPKTIPVLNLMIFDGAHFLVGGYYGPTAKGDSKNLYIQNETIGTTLTHYFDYLWNESRLLNGEGTINRDEIRRCALELGYSVKELNTKIALIAEEVGFSDVKFLQYKK